MEIMSPQYWEDYQLIDSGDGEKLERFGKYITIRPEPQAVWGKNLSDKEWEKRAHVKFISKSSSQGSWKKFKNMPDDWQIEYKYKQMSIKFRLALTSFKHVGIFPEQAANWTFLYDGLKEMKTPKPKVLNLFAYTGGATLAAKAAGADVIHLDSIKQVVSWANKNMLLSGLSDVRWMVEDAMKYLRRAKKRGEKFNGLIMDPPAYGHGPKGESWKLERDVKELVDLAMDCLEDESVFIMNTYSLGFSALILENLLANHTAAPKNKELGELVLKSETKQTLPLGVFIRFKK